MEDLAFIKKRSVTNMNIRETSKEPKLRERSQNHRTINRPRNDKSANKQQKSNNPRSSSIEMNIYNQTQAVSNYEQIQNQKDARMKQQRKSSTGSNSRLYSQQNQKIPNLDLNRVNKITPEIIINQDQAISQRKQLSKIQQQFQNESSKNLQSVKYLSQPESIQETKRVLPDRLQSKEIKQNQKSLLHSSTSQLEQFSLSGFGIDTKQFMPKNNFALSKIMDVVQVDETEFLMPAHSHRGFSKQKLLSISADKNSGGGAAMELMKSTMNMQQNLSLIQSKNLQNQTNNNQISKASIERDIKYLKINTDQNSRKPTKTLMQMTSNQKNRIQMNSNLFQNNQDDALGTIGEVVLKKKEEPKKRLAIQTQARRSKDITNQHAPISTKNKVKKPHHSQKTSMAVPYNMGTKNTGSTSSIQMMDSDILSPQNSSPKNVNQNLKKGGQQAQHSKAAENYKKLILENAKILQFQSNLVTTQTPKDSKYNISQDSNLVHIQKFKSTSGQNNNSSQNMNINSLNNSNNITSQNTSQSRSNKYHPSLIKASSHQVDQNNEQMQQPQLLKFQSMQTQHKGQRIRAQQFNGDQIANFSSLPLQIQGKDAQVSNSSMYYASQAIETGIGRGSQGQHDKRNVKQQKQISLNLAQLQGGVTQIQPSSNSAAKSNEIKLRPQKSSGSNNQQSISHLTGVQHGSMGLTTFIKSNGNANTTASSNTLFLNNKSQVGQKSLLNFQNNNMMQMTNSNINVTSNSQFDNTQKISSLLQKTQKIQKRKDEKQLDKSAPTAKKLYQKHHSQYEDNFDL